jgi:DNA-binding transcriptional ArsR family regulator
MAGRAAKDALFEGFAEVAKALASGRRAEIVDVLAQGERPVEAVADEIGQSVANTSHHLRATARNGSARHTPGRHADLLPAGQRRLHRSDFPVQTRGALGSQRPVR